MTSVSKPSFCAGLIAEDGVIIEAAPILRRRWLDAKVSRLIKWSGKMPTIRLEILKEGKWQTVAPYGRKP